MELETLLVFISFIAIIVGIIGNKWDKSKVGLKKLTLTGWITILIGIITCSASLYKINETEKELVNKNNEIKLLKQDKERVKKTAYTILLKHLDNSMTALNDLHEEANFKFHLGDSVYNSKGQPIFNELRSKRFTNCFYTIGFRDGYTKYSNYNPWDERLKLFSETIDNNFNDLIYKFKENFDTETILAMTDFQQDEFKSALIGCPNLSLLNEENCKISILFIENGGEKYYNAYLDKLERLYKICNKNLTS